MMRLGMRGKILATVLLPVLLLAVVLGGYLARAQMNDLEHVLTDRAVVLVRHLAVASDYGIFTGNRAALQTLAEAVRKEPDVNGVLILDGTGQELARSGVLTKHAESMARALREGRNEDDQLMTLVQPVVSTSLIPDDAVLGVETTRAPDLIVGAVAIEVSRTGLARLQRDILVTVCLLMIGAGCAALLLTFWLARAVSRPIANMTKAVESIGQGVRHVRVPTDRNGTLTPLANGINGMAERLDRVREDLEHRVKEATLQLAEKKDEAERANRAKSRFLAAASHDLRQPIHALGLFIAELIQRKHDAASTRLIRQVEAATDAVSNLLDALLDVSRLDAGVVEPRIRDFALQPLLMRLNDEFADAAGTKGLELVVHTSPVWIKSDPVLIERILLNLLSNAIRYTNEGRILLAVRWRKNGIRLEVRDTGIGIAEESQEQIFHEFVQLHNPERDRKRGLGLGLAIVRRLADLLGHRLELKSEVGKGSIFSIELPRGDAQHAEETARQDMAAIDGLEGVLISVVDDDALARNSLSSLLESWGSRVVSAPDHATMRDLLRGVGEPPRVILCDLRLSSTANGVDVLDALRSEFGASIPGALITGDTESAALRTASRRGYPLVHKPLKPAQLRALVRNLLRGS